MTVLGIADSYDAGATLVRDCSPVIAVNEERFTRKKNDVGFPYESVRHIRKNSDDDVQATALAWIGGNALISRVLPSWGARRRLEWRRELPKPSRLRMHVTNLAYGMVQDQKPRLLWRSLGTSVSTRITRRRLSSISTSLADKKLYMVEHHLAHAACAYYSSGFRDALVVTLDGAGDGISGTVSIGEHGSLKRVAEFDASASVGIFYGAATMACDMRYGEDEGKLMSLAAYSYPKRIPELEGMCRYDKRSKRFVSARKARSEALLAEYMKDHILAHHDRESFAYAVQSQVERQVAALVSQWVEETGIRDVAVGGGFFSNVKANQLLEHMPEVRSLFVFPHMGDGGLSYGAAMYVDFMLNGRMPGRQLQSIYLGPSYSNEAIKASLKTAKGVRHEEVKDPAKVAAELIADKNRIVLWFQGAMEFGPRALGNRSVLALPGDAENRNKINLIIKKRPYYQPFASSILEEDAGRLLEDYVRPDRFMTSANRVKDKHFEGMVAASHIDRTTRPQILGSENRPYRELIEHVKKKTGIGAVLNTSFNRHGMPIVLAPDDALWTLENTGADTLVMGNYVVEKKR